MMPGVTWKYSGGGTTIAQQAIVDATGTPFPELLRELVVEPCGMGRATFEQPLPERLHEYGAIGHLPDGSPVKGRWHTYPEMAAAGLWCAPRDLVAFAGAVQDAVAGKTALLPQELAGLLVTPDPVAVGRKMAVGFFLSSEDEDQEPQRFGHGGGDHGFLTDLSADINGTRAAAAMVHSLSGGEVAQKAMRAAGAAVGWPEPTEGPIDQAGLIAALGPYRADDGRTFELALDGGVTLTVPGQPSLPLEMVTLLTWTSKLGVSVVLEVEDRAVTAITVNQAGHTIKATRET